MTWLEVIDSAVKIGLGALIAGVSALVLYARGEPILRLTGMDGLYAGAELTLP